MNYYSIIIESYNLMKIFLTSKIYLTFKCAGSFIIYVLWSLRHSVKRFDGIKEHMLFNLNKSFV